MALCRFIYGVIKKSLCPERVVHPGGHWPRKGVWGCAAVMTPFLQASRRSLAYQFTIIAPLLCPPFSNFRKKLNFQPCFGQNFSSQDANFPNFRSLDPSFFKENPLPRPYFWKPVWHIPTQKKSWVPHPRGCPRTLRIYRWLSDYYSIIKTKIAALWSCSGRPGASLLGQDVVASLLSLCMAKWLRKWWRGWLYVRSNTHTKKTQSLYWPQSYDKERSFSAMAKVTLRWYNLL